LPSSSKTRKICYVLAFSARSTRIGRIHWLLIAVWLCGSAALQRVAGAPVFSDTVFDVSPVGADWEQGTVTSLIQSREGYLWLGTYHGLVRFDGVRYTVFDANTRGLQNGVITSLYESPDGVLWIGHETGQVTRFAEGLFHPVRLPHALLGSAIEAITSDQSGEVWLLNGNGLLLRISDGYSAQVPGDASPTRKIALARASDGKVWLVCNGRVCTLENGQVLPFGLPNAPASDFYERVLPAHDGGLWVLGNGTLRKWRYGRWVAQLDAFSTTSGAVTVLLEARSGALLVGSLREGLALLSPGTEPLRFNRANGLSHDWVRALCEDHEGNIWVATGAGLDALRRRKIEMLTADDSWQGCAVLSFTVCPDGSAWVGTEGAGLYHYSPPPAHHNRLARPTVPAQQLPNSEFNPWTLCRAECGISNSFVWSVLQTRSGGLFVGTWGGGLLLKNGDRFQTPDALAQVTAPVPALYEGHNGELWIGTTTGVHRYQNGSINWSAGKDQLAFPDVRAIAQSPDGTLWFGLSGGGLGVLTNGLTRQYRKQDGLGSDFVISLYADPDGTLWIGTADNGLTRLRRGRFANINPAKGLPTSLINHIVDDGAGNLWLGTLRGILRASKTDLNRCADNAAGSLHCIAYGKSEGLTSQVCSGGFQPGACKGPDGRLWFPTAKGLAIIDPLNVTTNPVPPPVVIEELLVDGQLVDLRPQALAPLGYTNSGTGTHPPLPARQLSLQIPAGSQRFELRYTGLSFIAPEKVRFRHRLQGLESAWVDAGTRRLAEYSYLPPGTYTFHVIASNNDGVWNREGASLAFTVLPYFWQTWWFLTGSVSLGASGIGAGVLAVARRRLRRRLRDLERQRALERERARIARDIHDDLGASLTRISMLSQSVAAEVESLPNVTNDVQQIYSTSRELTRAMDEIVWAVNPKHDTLDSLVTYLGRFAQQFLSSAAIRCRLDVPVSLPPSALTSEIRHGVFLALKETLNNVIKHARATEVRISLELQPTAFRLIIADNGRGFDFDCRHSHHSPDASRIGGGNGIQNITRRLEEIGGRSDWQTTPGNGTRVTFAIPLQL
jgi:signal transduction histidine kinase/ligand-binding sensor domain-containing protein